MADVDLCGASPANDNGNGAQHDAGRGRTDHGKFILMGLQP